MKKTIYLALCSSLVSGIAYSQQIPPTVEDALRSAWFIPNGTARSVAIGGAMGSLGGDLSAANVNPAGIGVYKTSEFVISPGVYLNNNTFDYRGTNSTSNQSAFVYGPTGLVFASGQRKGNWTSSAFSLSVTQLASYNNHQTFNGVNNYSSYSEQFLEELIAANASLNDASTQFPFGSSLAYNTYLVDGTFDNNGNLTGYASYANPATGLLQRYDETTKGGLHEISLGFAGNKNDKWYIGSSINIPISSYKRELIYSEDDATADTSNHFAYFDHQLKTSSSGVGINAKLGVIYKASNALRLGFAFHTPSYIGYRDDISAAMSTNTEGYQGVKYQASEELTNDPNSNVPTRYYYGQITPYRLIASGSYMLTGAHSSQQKGFISADVEFVNYRGVRYSASNGEDGSYYSALNDAIKSYYKGNFNFRLGGEMKFDVWMVRLGGSYYGSPYKDSELKASRAQVSGGLGYRNKGYFVDLTFAQSFNKDVIFPYRLADKANTFADAKNSRSNVMLTFGVKF